MLIRAALGKKDPKNRNHLHRRACKTPPANQIAKNCHYFYQNATPSRFNHVECRVNEVHFLCHFQFLCTDIAAVIYANVHYITYDYGTGNDLVVLYTLSPPPCYRKLTSMIVELCLTLYM